MCRFETLSAWEYLRKKTQVMLCLCLIAVMLGGCNTMIDGSKELFGYAGTAGRFMGRKVLEGVIITGNTIGEGAVLAGEGVLIGTATAVNALQPAGSDQEYDYGGGYYAKPVKRKRDDFYD